MVNNTLVLLQGYFCVENSACEVPKYLNIIQIVKKGIKEKQNGV
jgi:hypothetical protein